MTTDQQGKDIYVCLRLREEREALGLGQQEIAAALGVSLKTVGRWEKQIAIPSDKLTCLSGLGFDVGYVLTGERRPTPESSLSDREREIIGLMRRMSEADRLTLYRTATALAATTAEPPAAGDSLSRQ